VTQRPIRASRVRAHRLGVLAHALAVALGAAVVFGAGAATWPWFLPTAALSDFFIAYSEWAFEWSRWSAHDTPPPWLRARGNFEDGCGRS
jgi:hypothetical protein